MKPSAPLRSRCSFLLPVALAGIFLGSLFTASPAMATSYKGWGDTGWTHDNKRDCCEDAVWLAQDDGAYQCETAGGVPKVRSGSARGLCDWDARGDGRNRVYRCTADAEVYCR